MGICSFFLISSFFSVLKLDLLLLLLYFEICLVIYAYFCFLFFMSFF